MFLIGLGKKKKGKMHGRYGKWKCLVALIMAPLWLVELRVTAITQFPMKVGYPHDQYLDAKHARDTLLENRRPEIGCFSKALEHVTSENCEQMSDTEQRLLGLALANCHFEATGRKSFPCDTTQNESTKECISRMSETAYIIFTQFFQQAVQLCIYIRAESWSQEVQSTIEELSQSSKYMNNLLLDQLNAQEAILYQTNVSISNQESLIELQDEAKQALWGSVESILLRINSFDGAFQRLEDITDGFRGMYSTMSGNIAGMYSLGYYVAASAIIWIITSMESTKLARVPLMILLASCLAIEVALQYAWTYLCSTTPNILHMHAFNVVWILKSTCEMENVSSGAVSASSLTPIHFALKMDSASFYSKLAEFTVSLEYCQQSLRWSCTLICAFWCLLTLLVYKDPSTVIDDKLEKIRREQQAMRHEQRYILQLLERPGPPRNYNRPSSENRPTRIGEPRSFGNNRRMEIAAGYPAEQTLSAKPSMFDPPSSFAIPNSSNYFSPRSDEKGRSTPQGHFSKASDPDITGNDRSTAVFNDGELRSTSGGESPVYFGSMGRSNEYEHLEKHQSMGKERGRNQGGFTKSSSSRFLNSEPSPSTTKKRSRDVEQRKTSEGELPAQSDDYKHTQKRQKGSTSPDQKDNKKPQRKRPAEATAVTRQQKRQRKSA